MCFIMKKTNNKSKIAKKDIICYKKVRSDLKPAIFQTKRKYILNKEYVARDSGGKPIKKLKIIKGKSSNYIDEGIHSYKNKFRTFENINIYNNEILIECIIPKGVRYYENYQEFVSKKIIPTKILTKIVDTGLWNQPIWITEPPTFDQKLAK